MLGLTLLSPSFRNVLFLMFFGGTLFIYGGYEGVSYLVKTVCVRECEIVNEHGLCPLRIHSGLLQC